MAAHRWPSYPYATRMVNGLEVSAVQWNENFSAPHLRQDRSNNEHYVAHYWQQSNIFGPQELVPATQTILTYVSSGYIADF